MSEQDQPALSAPAVNDGNSIGVIDSECLINEVRKYPILYTKADNGQDVGGQEWYDVCTALFSQWDTLDSEERIEKLSAVQRKWKELKENFFNSGGGTVQHLSPAAKKKRQQRFESMSFLIQTEDMSDVDMGDNEFQKNNNEQYTGDMENVPDFEQPPGDITDEFPAQCPPEQTPKTPKAITDFEDFNDLLRTFEHTLQEEEPTDEYPLYLNAQFAQILVPLLNTLTREQLLTVWPKIINIVKEASKPKKKIIILQNELKYRTGEGPIDFVQPYPQVHMPSIVGHYPPQLQGQSLVDHYSAQLQGASLVDQYSAQLQGASLVDHYSAQLQGQGLAEITLPLIEDMDSMPPSSHGRPTNERGEIIYPETDPEDVDDV